MVVFYTLVLGQAPRRLSENDTQTKQKFQVYRKNFDLNL